MKSKEQLREEYENGHLDRPARLRHLKDSIEEHTGLQPPRRPGEIEEWWSNNKAVLARKLNEDDEETEEEADETTDTEETNDD